MAPTIFVDLAASAKIAAHDKKSSTRTHAFGGTYVNNYTISGSDSATGLDVLNQAFPQQGGYGGQIVFHARSGTVTAQQAAVNQSVTNVSKLPHIIRAVSPFAAANSVNPPGLYLCTATPAEPQDREEACRITS